MENSIQSNELNEFFSMFHDFEIKTLKHVAGNIHIVIEVPWGELWDDYDYRIELIFSDCDKLECVYENNRCNIFHAVEKSGIIDYSCIKKINDLSLIIRDYKQVEFSEFIFFCKNSESNLDVQLGFRVRKVQVLDREGSTISLEKMKEWSQLWWNSIKRMWDDQNNM